MEMGKKRGKGEKKKEKEKGVVEYMLTQPFQIFSSLLNQSFIFIKKKKSKIKQWIYHLPSRAIHVMSIGHYIKRHMIIRLFTNWKNYLIARNFFRKSLYKV